MRKSIFLSSLMGLLGCILISPAFSMLVGVTIFGSSSTAYVCVGQACSSVIKPGSTSAFGITNDTLVIQLEGGTGPVLYFSMGVNQGKYTPVQSGDSICLSDQSPFYRITSGNCK